MLRYQFPGDNMPGVPPVPIPNTAVKPRAADGSRTLGPARVGRCQVYAPSVSPTLGALFLSPRPPLRLPITPLTKLAHRFPEEKNPDKSRRGFSGGSLSRTPIFLSDIESFLKTALRASGSLIPAENN